MILSVAPLCSKLRGYTMAKAALTGITQRLKESASILKAIAESRAGDIELAAQLIISAYRNGGKVVLLGNGGSAADAQHLAGELVGKFMLKRQAFPAIALTTNSSILTAVANDWSYDTVFSRQIEALVTEKDIIIGISTSGNSPNVIEAIKQGKKKGAKTIALTGADGGKLADAADLVLSVPSDITPRIQEAHITIGHIICELVERELADTTE